VEINTISKIIFSSLIIGVFFIILDGCSAIILSPVYARFSGLEIFKTAPSIRAGLLFDVLNGFILVTVFMVIQEGLPGGLIVKGIYFGFIVGLFRVLMNAFSSYVMYNIPPTLLIYSSLVWYVEIIVLGVLTSLVYQRFF